MASAEGGLKQKAEANLAAIRALKILEVESRPATPEEKALLVKYTGWGAMPNAFASLPSRDWQSVADELKDLTEHGGVRCVSARGQPQTRTTRLPDSHSGDLASDGAVRTKAWGANPRTVDGRRSFLWHDARNFVSRHETHRPLSLIQPLRASPPHFTRDSSVHR